MAVSSLVKKGSYNFDYKQLSCAINVYDIVQLKARTATKKSPSSEALARKGLIQGGKRRR